jgi:hypothetical protein
MPARVSPKLVRPGPVDRSRRCLGSRSESQSADRPSAGRSRSVGRRGRATLRDRARAWLAGSLVICAAGASQPAHASEQEILATFAQAREALEAGGYRQAAELCQKALDQARVELGDDHESTALLAYNTGQIYAELEIWTPARAALELALPGYAKLHGETSPRLLPVIERLLDVYGATQELDGTIALLERRLAIAGATDGPESAAAAVVMRDLADALVFKADDASLRRAARLVRAARRVATAAEGETSAAVGETYLVSARVGLAEGNLASATEDLRKAFQVLDAALPEGDARLLALYRREVARAASFPAGEGSALARELRERLARHEAAASARSGSEGAK